MGVGVVRFVAEKRFRPVRWIQPTWRQLQQKWERTRWIATTYGQAKSMDRRSRRRRCEKSCTPAALALFISMNAADDKDGGHDGVDYGRSWIKRQVYVSRKLSWEIRRVSIFMCDAVDGSRWLGLPRVQALPTLCCGFDVYRCAYVCRPYPLILIVSRCSLHVALDGLSVWECSISFFFNMLVFGTLMSVSQLTCVRVYMTLRCNKRYNICSTAR